MFVALLGVQGKLITLRKRFVVNDSGNSWVVLSCGARPIRSKSYRNYKNNGFSSKNVGLLIP